MNPADFIISLTSADGKDRRKTRSCHGSRRWWLARFCTLSNLLKCNNLVRWANWLSSQHPVVLMITAHALSSPPEKMLFGEVTREGVKKLSCFYSQHLQFDNTAVPDTLRSKQHLCAASWFETGRFKYYIDKIVKCKIRYCRTSLIPRGNSCARDCSEKKFQYNLSHTEPSFMRIKTMKGWIWVK